MNGYPQKDDKLANSLFRKTRKRKFNETPIIINPINKTCKLAVLNFRSVDKAFMQYLFCKSHMHQNPLYNSGRIHLALYNKLLALRFDRLKLPN